MANRGRQKKTAARKGKQRQSQQGQIQNAPSRQHHRFAPELPMGVRVQRNKPVLTLFDEYSNVWKEPDTNQEYQHPNQTSIHLDNSDVND